MAPPRTIKLRVGQSDTIRLPGRGTAGYEWTVEISQDRDDTVVVREVDPDDHELRPPGESRDHVFVLSAQQPGRAVARFEQRRPWEREAAPLEVYEVEVIVEA